MPQRGAAPSGEHRIGDWLIAGADDWEPRRSRRTDRLGARTGASTIARPRARTGAATMDTPRARSGAATIDAPRARSGAATMDTPRARSGVATIDSPRTEPRRLAPAARPPATSDPVPVAADAPGPAAAPPTAAAPGPTAGAPTDARSAEAAPTDSRRARAVPTDSRPTEAGVPGRRTVTIRGRGAERYVSSRPSTARRPSRRRHERSGFRPDRAAMWAVLLGLMLILVAATSAHAATLHALVSLR